MTVDASGRAPAARSPRVAVVTIAHGRHDHLVGQVGGLLAQTLPPDLHVVVAMDDDAVGDVARRQTQGRWSVVVVDVPRHDGHLPLACARNVGVAAARDHGAEVVVLLDVDCIPSPTLVERYVAALEAPGRPGRPTRPAQPAQPGARPPAAHGDRPLVACGEVRYLDAATTALPASERTPDRLDAGSAPHAARPVPGRDSHEVVEAEDLRLYWSLSFATTVDDWDRIGGFDEAYVGYGAEDTDFGQRIGAAGGRMLWVGGATAWHQHHGGSGGPPVQHVADVVANGRRFAERWGWWPMEGWLEAFRELGLVRQDGDGSWLLTRAEGSDHVAAVVLTGGASSRMGTHKPAIEVAGRPLVQRVLDAVSDRTVVVVGRADAVPSGVPVVMEEPPGGGPVAGLSAGVRALVPADPADPDGTTPDASETRLPDVTLVLAADLPLLTSAHVDRLVRAVTHGDAPVAVTTVDGRRSWLCAAWRTRTLVDALDRLGDPRDRSVRSLVGALPVVDVAATDDAATDVDTPDDLRRVHDLLRRAVDGSALPGPS